MIKCNFYKCGKELIIENHEVFAVRLFRTMRLKQGKEVTVSDGHRWCCEEHYNLVKSGKVKPSTELIYGPRSKSRNRRRNRKTTAFKVKKL